MVKFRPGTFLVLATLAFASGHPSLLNGPNHLHAVQSLYVKPSSDGTTGDLYVAATEDGAVKQWLSEPANFLPQIASYASIAAAGLPNEAVTNQKRAVIASPPLQYSYGVPVPVEGSVANAIPAALPTYPYTIPTAAPVATEGSEAAVATPATPFYPYPFHLYYSQMMSAFANALNNAKETSSEEGANGTAAVVPQAPMWPYSYPLQYVMVDPTAWAKAQASAPTQQSPTPATNNASNETS